MATVGRLSVSRLSSLLTAPTSRVLMPTRLMSQGWQQYGVVGSNLPFSMTNRYKLTALFIVFFGSGFNLPFIVVAHQLHKHSGQ